MSELLYFRELFEKANHAKEVLSPPQKSFHGQECARCTPNRAEEHHGLEIRSCIVCNGEFDYSASQELAKTNVPSEVATQK